MKTKDIYFGTMKFVWLKLAMGAAVTLASIVLLVLFMLIGSFFGGAGLYLMLCLWIVATRAIEKVVMYYFGYMVKAGHVAVIAAAVTTGKLPENQFAYGKQMVQKRFAASNVYFVVDRLVSGAVRQLQKVIGKVGGMLDVVPGMSQITSFLQTFVGIALGYVDECCLGYCFLKEDEGAFKASCDGVVIYFQNAKKLLKDAAVTTAIVMAATFVAWVLPFVVLVFIFQAMEWNLLIAVLLALIIAISLKSAFIDSFMLVKMMVSYMEAAPSTEITFQLYDKLCGISSKFKELFGKAKKEGPILEGPVMAGSYAEPAVVTAAQETAASRFCPNCGQPVSGGRFCGKCGAKL